MNLAITPIQMMTITEVPGLDPVRAFFEDVDSSGAGRVTFTCYGRAWVFFWSGMGNGVTIKQFFVKTDTEYLVNKFVDHTQAKAKVKGDIAYLTKIVNAIKGAIRLQGTTVCT